MGSRTTLRAWAWTLLAGLLAACADRHAEPFGPARYDLAHCARATLIDVSNGARVVGAEDLAVDRAARRLIVSAYDRRAAERAARRGAFLVPEGGVYAVDLVELLARDGRLVPARPLAPPSRFAGGLRPHGLSFDPAAREIAFVNRSYQKIDRRWRMTPRLERIGANGEVVFGGEAPAGCAANDLASVGGAALVTFDHGACGWRAAMEDVFALKRSGVANDDGARLFDGVQYANGIAVAADAAGEATLAVAATREAAILRLASTGGDLASGERLRQVERIDTPGGPDNLTVSPDGGVVAAVHPSLWRLALHRKLGIGDAPSRVVKVDVGGARVEPLLDDPTGATFAGATVAVELGPSWGGALVVGSATDAGLLVCRAPVERTRV